MSCATGIDVSEGTLEVLAGPHEASQKFRNTTADIQRLIAFLAPMKPTRVVFEASGGYEKSLMNAVMAKGWTACRVNAKRVHHFSLALGQHAKTDPVDAAVLQRYGDLMEPAGSIAPDPAHAQLLVLVKRRNQLVAIRTGEINRSHQAEAPVVASHQRLRRVLDREIQHMERDIDACIKQSPPIAEQVKLLASTPGIATVIASTLQAPCCSILFSETVVVAQKAADVLSTAGVTAEAMTSALSPTESDTSTSTASLPVGAAHHG